MLRTSISSRLASCASPIGALQNHVIRSSLLTRRVTMASAAVKPVVLYDLLPDPGICPYAQRAKIVLREKSIPYEQTLIDAQNKPQDFLDLFRSITANPNGRGTVPTIIDGDVKLTESHIVSEYLDTKSGSKLFPTDPAQLALVRLFVELYSSEVASNTMKLLQAKNKEDADAAKAGFTHGLKVINDFLKAHSKEGDYLLGADFSYAEVATLPFVYRALLMLPHYRNVDPNKIIAENGLTHLKKWIEVGLQRPSLRETLPPADVIVKLYAKFVADLK